MANSPPIQQSSHSTIKSLNEAAKNKLSEAFPDKSRLLIDLFEGTDPGKAARDIRTALKNEERGKPNDLLWFDDALDKAVDKSLRDMYDKVFEICKEENLVSYSKGGADKGVIDVAGQTMQYHQHPQSKLTRFAPPSEGLSQAVIIRCSKSGAYLTLGPPDGNPIEIACPKELEKQCTFDIKYYQEQMSKTSHNIFTAARVDAPNTSLDAPNRADIVAATTSFTQHGSTTNTTLDESLSPQPTPTLLNELERQEKENARNV